MDGARQIDQKLELDSLYHTADYDYQDVTILAFPTLDGDLDETYVPSAITSNEEDIPWEAIFNPSIDLVEEDKNPSAKMVAFNSRGFGSNTWVKLGFDQEVKLRTIVLSPIRTMVVDKQYPVVKMNLRIQAMVDGKFTDVSNLQIPSGNWTDRQYNLTLSIPETTSDQFKITFQGEHRIKPQQIHLSGKARMHNHEAKAAKVVRSFEKGVVSEFHDGVYINPENIIDLTDNLSSSGILSWDAPPGKWTLVRFGHVNMRRTNKPAVPEATGWEASKLDKVAVENHLRKGMIGDLITDGGPIGDGKLQGLLIDSWESYVPTWSMDSDSMFSEFKRRRGYDLKKYLPATIGYIIENPEVTSKFLRDLRHTMDDLFIDNFFKHFATVAHDMGAEVYTEGAGGEVLPIDPMRYYGVSDVPMTEFWYPRPPSTQNEYGKPIFPAASASHLYNKPILAAEACTQIGVKWNEHPFTVKYLIDYNFTKGVNHLVFHTFSHTPQKTVYPGSSFGSRIGFPFVRQQTWWKHMPAWIDYLSRNQLILQEGEYVADILWYFGDHHERPPYDLDYFPKGYRFDYLNTEVLHERLSMDNGKIQVEGAGQYRLILLRDSEEILLSTAKRLRDLVLQGAVILGDKPLDSPSLMDDAKDLEELKSISDDMWGNTSKGVKKVGKGKVYWGYSIDEVLEQEEIAQDVMVPDDLDINWIHRKSLDADYYFVSTKSDLPLDAALSFRIQGAYPQVWDAFTGRKEDALVWKEEDGRITVAISLDPSGSALIVFPKGTRQAFASKIELDGRTIMSTKQGWHLTHKTEDVARIALTKGKFQASKAGNYLIHEEGGVRSITTSIAEIPIQDSWKASFEDGWDTPESITIPHLKSLSELENEAIRHYSGTVTYHRSVNIANAGRQVIIDLGRVANIAEVWCNDLKVTTKWAPPFTFDLTEMIKQGANKLEIRVTNTWRNQLIFDNARPDGEKKTWTSNPPTKEESDLDESGLIGPVALKIVDANS